MKGIKFYLEYPNQDKKRKGTRAKTGKHMGTVLAVFHKLSVVRNDVVVYDAIGSVADIPNSHVCNTSVSDLYLRLNCLYIGEQQARLIHPKLFSYLDK